MRDTTLLLDTNVCLSYYLPDRKESESVHNLISQAIASNVTLAVAATTLKDMYYIARKYIDEQTARQYIELFLDLFVVLSVGQEACELAARSDEPDFEDGLIRAVAEIAHRHGALVIVDNTFMTPYLQQPLALGADIVVHSATKYLGGHSDLVAGLAVVKTRELADKLAFVQNSTGAVLGPQDAFLLIRGIKTLAVRLDRHVENAAYLADWLAGNLEVKKIYYPGLTSHIGYEINQQQAKNGGAMISFELAEGHDIRKFFKALQLIALAESLGGVESLVCHPATMTHAAIPRETREKIGITDNLIRLSVGIEDKADLLADLKQAIEESRI